MKKLAGAAAILLLMAACSDKAIPQGNTGKQAAQVETTRAEKPRKLKAALPEGIELGFSHHLLSDRIVDREGKPDRRRVTVEYLGLDQKSAFESLSKSFATAGFGLQDQTVLENGNIRAKFRKPKFGTAIVTVTTGSERKKHPEAMGKVVLDWPVRDRRGSSASANGIEPGVDAQAK